MRRTAKSAEGSQAFTLLEMLGVLSILAIVLSLAIPVLQKTRAKSREARAKSDIGKIESALNLYKLDYGIGPDSTAADLIMASSGDYTILNSTAAGPLSPSTTEPYLKLPASQVDPVSRQFLDPWKSPYWIRSTATQNTGFFDVYSSGPDKTKGNSDDINNWSR